MPNLSVQFTGDLDAPSLSYTELPVPVELTVKPSGIPGGRLGVFANIPIPMSAEMGPYQGRKLKQEDMNEIFNNDFAWEVRK